jgi:chromosomal replication initiation ATPase DnaA
VKVRQLALDLPHRVALGREDFLVSDSNRAAVAMIDSWPAWPTAATLLIGPPGSGKSHLVEVWRQMSGAQVIASDQLKDSTDMVTRSAVAVDDLPGDSLDETALFHLLNLAREVKANVLLVSALRPRAWDIKLPDLGSRLNALPVATIGPADDALLRGVLVKLFADRQLAVDEALLSYLIARMPRSLETARHVVAEIDRRALEEGISVTRASVARLLPQVIDDAQLNLFIE